MVTALGITPFGTIPYMQTPNEVQRRRIALFGTFVGVLVGVTALLYLVDTFITPVDSLLVAVAHKVGLGGIIERLLPSFSG
jgi:hypothetical protein